MSYLLDKKVKRKKFFYTAFFVIVLLVLFYFRGGISRSFSFVGHTIFRPVFVVGNSIGEKLGSLGSYFISKKTLFLENQNLKSQILESQADRTNYDSVVADNANLKDVLGRKDAKVNMVLSAILSKPNVSPYDTLVVDVGTNQSAQIGDRVFALGNVPIGRVATVFPNSSKVILFSNSGEKTQVVIGDKNIFLEVVGRGGGNFEMTIPRDFIVQKGDQAVLPGITPYVVGIVETIISDPRDPSIKALLVSPVNIQELKFVEVDEQR